MPLKILKRIVEAISGCSSSPVQFNVNDQSNIELEFETPLLNLRGFPPHCSVLVASILPPNTLFCLFFRVVCWWSLVRLCRMPTHEMGMNSALSHQVGTLININDIAFCPITSVSTTATSLRSVSRLLTTARCLSQPLALKSWWLWEQVFITYIDHGMQYHQLMADMRDLCGFAPGQELTVK